MADTPVKQFLEKSPLYPVLLLDRAFSATSRRQFAYFASGLLFLSLILAMVFSAFDSDARLLAPKLWGMFLLSIALFLSAKIVELYFNSSFYFENIALNKYSERDLLTISVGRILILAASDGDVARAFLRSETGRKIARRAGIEKDDINKFLRDTLTQSDDFNPPEDVLFKLKDLSQYIVQLPRFSDVLKKAGVTETVFLGATDWVRMEIETREIKKRWWLAENLSRAPGLAKDWGFGTTPTLDKFGWDMLGGVEFETAVSEYSARRPDAAALGNILAKRRDACALVVASSQEEALSVVWQFALNVKNGAVDSALEHFRPVYFNVAMFLAETASAEAEKNLIAILDEAARAGNVILTIDDLYNLNHGVENRGGNLLGLLENYLRTGGVKIIGLVTDDIYHRFLSSNTNMMNIFDRIYVKPLDAENIVGNLKQSIWEMELKYGLFFTYPALLEIERAAADYYAESDSADKAVDLVMEMIPWLQSRGLGEATLSVVRDFLRTKVDMPIGEISSSEREKLKRLEENLHRRVIGQTAAISSVANSLRRFRAGIRNPNRPIGSFLFLGPTGVGKTETAKALAEVYFGSEKNLMRLDMSEFQGKDALMKLIGDFASGAPGILTRLLRERPYGVLLLDEFEKTDRDVLNLFLQILDEGFFADMVGRRVNARNIIFIATSNAGAEVIWRFFREGKKPEQHAEQLIDYIVQSGIFRPELLNRFDATVVYHPLTGDELKQIAFLMLSKLAKRLADQGLSLNIGDDLARLVSTEGANEVFGARPMQRYIQDNIEKQIADSLIEGEISRGSNITFQVLADGSIRIAVSETVAS